MRQRRRRCFPQPRRGHEEWDFAESTFGATRIGDYKYRLIDQPGGWMGGTVKVDWPILINLRLDPFERTGMGQSQSYADWQTYEIWRYVFMQQEVGKMAQTFVDYPQMQTPASFNAEAIKQQVAELQKGRTGR